MSTSSSPDAERLAWVPLDRLHPHPANPNRMTRRRLEKLARNIKRSDNYEPLAVRPDPEHPGEYQLLNGHQRHAALRLLGHQKALCYVWPCDDETALILIATLNRLRGEDEPGLRASLLDELSQLIPEDELALLLPEDSSEIEQTLSLVELDPAELLAELTAAAEQEARTGPRAFTVALEPDDEADVQRAIDLASEQLEGINRRGRGLALICRAYLGAADA